MFIEYQLPKFAWPFLRGFPYSLYQSWYETNNIKNDEINHKNTFIICTPRSNDKHVEKSS